MEPIVEKATINDAEEMHQLINYFAGKDEMLPRALSDIYESIRDYLVVRQGGRVTGCAALHVMWSDLAEVKSVAVAEDSQRQGIGSGLVEACLSEARLLGLPTVFCLTYKPAFFQRFGFSEVDKMELPRKVWTECYHCSKFPDCDEVALICNLEMPAATE
ncbi:MAG: N-acetyltransferase [Dehalococcoidales bacterium]|nr:MAG: N-acetyltransferase [Dehalococcoidales bacterium]